MIRRLVLAGALLALLAGCGGSGHRTISVPTTTKKKPLTPPKRTAGPAVQLVLTVLDGDWRTRVRGARVSVAGRSARTDGHGVAEIQGRLGKLEVSVSAHGYEPAAYRVNFKESRRQTVRIYQPALQWPIYGATPARTEAPPGIKLRPPFRVVWSRPLGRLIEFPASVDSGVAYIGNAIATVHALSMRTGKFLWVHETSGSPRMASSPAVDGNEIVYHTMSGWVYVLNRSDGRLLWGWNAGSAIESSPIVINGIDYFGDAGGEIYALDLRTHKVRWQHYAGAKITSSAAIAGGRLFIGDYNGRVWALSPATGAVRWTGQVNGKIYGTPAVADGRVFVPSSDGDSLTAFSTSGRYLWRFSTPGYYEYSSPATADGIVCVGSYDGSFYGLSAATGSVRWRVYVGGWISGAAVIVDGVAYAGSFQHRIVGVDLHSGRKVLTFPHGEYVPVSGNGMRLLLNGFSRVYAVEPRGSRRR